MLKSLGQFIDDLVRPGASAIPATDELRLCATALLIHATAIDGQVTEAEQAQLADIVAAQYGVSGEALRALIIEAERREQRAIDIYGFTSRLKAELSDAERLALIEVMWDIAYADGTLDPLEDNLIWRTAELLGVPSRDRLAAKAARRLAGT